MTTKRNSEDIDIAKEREERILNAIQDSSRKTETKMEEIKSEIRNIKNDISKNTRHVKTILKQNFWGYIVTATVVLGIYIAVCYLVWTVLRE